MSDAAAVTAAPAKASKKRAGGAAKAKKHSADHPTYSEMIKAALGALKVCDISLHYSARHPFYDVADFRWRSDVVGAKSSGPRVPGKNCARW